MKKNRLAIVGPSDSVALIESVAQEKKELLETLPIVYSDASEVPQIIKKYDDTIDFWLFSGIVPYYHAQTSDVATKPMYYVTHTGSSLYRVLVQMAYHENSPIQRMSFDTFSLSEIQESFHDLSPHVPKFYLYEYNDIVSAGLITDYHYNLWKEGKIDVAVTCFYSSYISLKKLGVPTFRIWPTRNKIRSLLRLATSDAKATHFKGSQIAIQHISIADYATFVRDSSSTYNAKRIELKLYNILLNYAESIQGSIVNHSNGQYTLYSTRGILENITHNFTILPVLDDITKQLIIGVNGGIGFGSTAHSADENAHVALGMAQQAGKDRWMVVLDDKTAMGPLNSTALLQYPIRSDDLSRRTLATTLNLSITTINRLLAACDKFEHDSINANDLAAYLGITPRSTRRLLTSMVNHNFAVESGEESYGKGRPSKLYKIDLTKLLK